MKFLKSLGYAFNGIRHSSIYETNFRVHLFTTFAVVVAGFCFALSNTEWLAVVTCCILVMTAEMFNTAIEVFCDCLVKESLPAIKIVKDVAAGAVLLTAIGSAVIGIVIFLPKIVHQINL